MRHQSEEIILGQLRSVIASMSIDEINRDRIKLRATFVITVSMNSRRLIGID